MIFQPTLTDTLSRIDEIKTFSFYKNHFVESDDPEHIHNCYEIYVNVSGDVSFLHNKSIYPIETGDIIIAAPGEVHYCIYHSSCVHEHFCLWFDTDEKSAVSEFINKHKLTGHIRLDSNKRKKLFLILHRFDTEKDPFERTMCFFELLKLLTEKNTDYTAENIDIPDKMQEILEFVDENYADIHFIKEIADRFHISIPTLNRWFRQYVHLSPSKLLTAKKLSYAEKLLRGDHSVADACFMAGFADCSRFIALFKSKYGLTPLQYKKRQNTVY
ncbi:MAG: helix-turn-helix domain-containing protein [Clostridia bacterium]|nr:helix-turn-helix domain-containing protein [Clostridia bacterium]